MYQAPPATLDKYFSIFLVFILIVGSILLTVSIPAIIAGVGLVYRKSWSRILALIICVIKLFNIPFGTALGAYGIWVLMQDETIQSLDK